jgi:hypothetical protein
MTVDAQLFRLRAFEEDWIGPLLKRAQQRSRRDDAASKMVFQVLIAESRHWLALGERVGYFPEGEAREMPHAAPFTEPFFRELDGEMDASLFARRLGEAQRHFTPDRMEYLRLLLFSDDDEFIQNLRAVELIAVELERRPGEIYLSRLGAIAWVGGEPNRARTKTLVHMPDGWRNTVPPGIPGDQQVYARWRALTDPKHRIISLTEWLAVDPATSPDVRRAAQITVRDRQRTTQYPGPLARTAEKLRQYRALAEEIEVESSETGLYYGGEPRVDLPAAEPYAQEEGVPEVEQGDF